MKKTFSLIALAGLAVFCLPHTLKAQCGGGQTYNAYCYDDGLVDEVAFEYCPAAGEIAQSTIIQGSFNTPLADNLTVHSGLSGSATAGTIVFGPASGNLANEVIGADAVDDCLIFVINSNTIGIQFSCADGTETELRVCSESNQPSTTATLTLSQDNFCSDDGVQVLSGGEPAGGTYSGTGVSDNGDGTFNFTPSGMGGQTITVTYDFSGSTATDEINVINAGSTTFTAPNDLCIDAGVQIDLSGGSPGGGTYSGPGVTDNGDGTFNFQPGVAGLGVHTLSYTDAGSCEETVTDDIEVLAACGCPNGQTANYLCYGNNQAEGVIFTICPNAGEVARADFTAGELGLDDILSVYQGSVNASKTVFGPRSNDPDMADEVVTATIPDSCLIFVLSTGPVGSCQDGGEEGIAVCGQSVTPTLAFQAPADLPVDAGVQTGLGGGLPAGGTYSGPGVTDGGDGLTYSFDPVGAGIGEHTLTYTTAPGDGSVVLQDELQVLASPPTLTCPADNFDLTSGYNPVVPSPAGNNEFNIEGDAMPESSWPTVSADPVAPLTLSSSDATVDDVCMRTVTRTYTITDAAGQTASCSQTFTFPFDETAPTAVCPTVPPTVTLDSDGNGTLPGNALAGGNSTDDCTTNPAETSPETSVSCEDWPAATVLLTATDDAGLTGTANCTVVILDNTPPTAICPTTPPSVILDSDGNGTLPANALAGGNSTDNCTVSPTETSPQTSFSCTDWPAASVVLTATDEAGLSHTVTCLVTIVDETAPTAICPSVPPTVILDSDGNGTLPANALAGGKSTDNCTTAPTETSPLTMVTCIDAPVTAVQLTATDDAGLSSTTNCIISVIEDNNCSLLSDCSPDPLNINTSLIPPGEYRTASTISSSGTVPSPRTVVFTAGTSINLTPGFHAVSGSVFTARIEDCIPNSIDEPPVYLSAPDEKAAENNQKRFSHPPETKPSYAAAFLKVFPNPLTNQATISLSLAEENPVEIGLFDLTGRMAARVLRSGEPIKGNHQFQLNADDLPAGLYILVARVGGQHLTRRLVIL